MEKEKARKVMIKVYTVFGFVLIAGAFVVASIPIAPYIWYRLNPNATKEEITQISKNISEEEPATKDADNIPKDIDTSLPEGLWVSIPKIGVLSPISTDSDYEEALKNGSWIVPGYGTPENNTLSIIVASHRFGYVYWDDKERLKISFYNLPQTTVGDTIDIYWNQKKYTYQIYKGEDKTYISDYSADLILYTCKYFNSPERIFRYANLVE